MSRRLAATVCIAIAGATATAGCAVVNSLFGNSLYRKQSLNELAATLLTATPRRSRATQPLRDPFDLKGCRVSYAMRQLLDLQAQWLSTVRSTA